ncbi:MAG: exodeoxyribonuclease VII small subunit [candidate division Zixibacteria bacterium]|nr:exodeoxyribonuclease VII small subunit [candidate division Zixibacteria bacterium]
MSDKKKPKDYESAVARLEEITGQLESGDTTLEDAIKLYTEGLEIAKFCDEKLSEAEKKIKVIMEKRGQLVEEDFEPDEETA